MSGHHHSITPTLPAIRDCLIPAVQANSTPQPHVFPTKGFFPGFSPAEIGTPRHKVPLAHIRAAYSAFIGSEKWQELRKLVITRANGRCESCGDFCASFEVHHITYERFGGCERIDDLTALCPSCHTSADTDRREKVRAALIQIAQEPCDDYETKGFDSWMVARNYGNDWKQLDDSTIDAELERFAGWCDREQESEGAL